MTNPPPIISLTDSVSPAKIAAVRAPAARAANTATTATIGAWLKAGYDLDVLLVIAERTAKPRSSPIRTWECFSQAIAARHAKRIAQAARSQGAGEAGAGILQKADELPHRGSHSAIGCQTNGMPVKQNARPPS